MNKDKREEILKDPIRQKLISGVEKIIQNYQNILIGFGLLALIMVLMHFRDIANKESVLEANTQFAKSQNLFINGQIDLVKNEFENIYDSYDGEVAANLSGLYLASQAYVEGDFDIAIDYLNQIKELIQIDPIQSNIYAMLASINMNRQEYKEALNNYSTAKNITLFSDFKIKFEIGEILALQAMDNHHKAIDISNGILDNDELKYSFKNTVEELLAFSKQKTM